MMNTPKNIDYLNTGKNPTVDSESSSFLVPFYKTDEYFEVPECRTRFIQACESKIRHDPRYKAYEAHLKSQGLAKCVMLGNIEELDKEKIIEMHHGPILTLWDYCDVLIDFCLYKKIPVTSFRVADMVLLEHLYGNIQVVFVSGTSHELAHARQIFINYSQSIGNLTSFISKYRKVISNYYVDKINKYLSRSRMYGADDFGIFDLNRVLYGEDRSLYKKSVN